MFCELCNKKHDGKYGSGRFCSKKCSRSFSTKEKRKEINQRVSLSLKNRPNKKGFKKGQERPQNSGRKKGGGKRIKCPVCLSEFLKSGRQGNKSCSKDCAKKLMSIAGKKSASIRRVRSKDEISLFNLCKENFEGVKNNLPIVDGWDADILLTKEKIAVLWNGPWHYKEMIGLKHSLKQVQTRDKIKEEKISKSGWKLLVFRDNQFDPISAFKVILEEALRRV